MIVFQCKCGYIWIIDLEAAKLIGPIMENQGKLSDDSLLPLFIGNNRKEISMGYFRDFYADCWGNLLLSIPHTQKRS